MSQKSTNGAPPTNDSPDGRPHVDEYAQKAEFPSEPQFELDEVVYVRFQSSSSAEGPYVVCAIEEGNMYRLKKQDTDEEYPDLVAEAFLETPDDAD